MQTKLTEGDYILVDGRAWFTVHDLSVHIRAHDGMLSVAVYPLGNETDPAIDQIFVQYHETQPAE